MKVVSIALLGQKDHGKSTLIGSLLMQTGAATKVRIREAEQYSKRLGKALEPAFILDSFAEERLNEMTIDTTRAEIKHKDIAFSLIDAPGHEELIKNMISGASYGEVALLLVSAKSDEGIGDQTKRHLFLSRMLGMSRLVVAVNKMDTVNYDQEKFNEIRNEISKFISKMGFDIKHVRFVPISAYRGENLTKKSTKMKWYRGRPLVDVLYENAKEERVKRDGALRIIMQGSVESGSGIFAVGRVVSGRVKAGESAIILPIRKRVKIGEIIVKGKKARAGNVGDNVALGIGSNAANDLRGTVISGIESKPDVTDSMKLRIFVTGKFERGMVARFNGIEIPCIGMRILHSIDTTTGDFMTSKDAMPLGAVEAEVKLAKEVAVERYDITRELGRFAFYKGSELKGIGIVI